MSSGSATSQNIFGPISSHVDPFWHFCTFIVFFLTFAGSKQELYCRLYLQCHAPHRAFFSNLTVLGSTQFLPCINAYQLVTVCSWWQAKPLFIFGTFFDQMLVFFRTFGRWQFVVGGSGKSSGSERAEQQATQSSGSHPEQTTQFTSSHQLGHYKVSTIKCQIEYYISSQKQDNVQNPNHRIGLRNIFCLHSLQMQPGECSGARGRFAICLTIFYCIIFVAEKYCICWRQYTA